VKRTTRDVFKTALIAEHEVVLIVVINEFAFRWLTPLFAVIFIERLFLRVNFV